MSLTAVGSVGKVLSETKGTSEEFIYNRDCKWLRGVSMLASHPCTHCLHLLKNVTLWWRTAPQLVSVWAMK